MKIAEKFAKIKEEKRCGFIPYITAGDPDLAATEIFADTLIRAGADILELGVPFSDPVADGPTNQKAAERALRSGTSLKGVMDRVASLRAKGISTPIVLFTYFNPLFKMGIPTFAALAKKQGVSGVLCVDLPPEEAASYRRMVQSEGVDTIFLASPTTSPARLKMIDESSSGFVYYVSRTGVTGARADLSASLKDELKRVKQIVRKPIAVGFGISKPEHARDVAQVADAVVVGSAIVRLIEESGAGASEKIRKFTEEMVAAIREKKC